ncbi:hypothetical protein HDU85_001512 [Gaertneriomyces sp. JEL0708]|nr:hypothetical protein HDU85_001512 [Gaertneriomyces sp. JEL0708]
MLPLYGNVTGLASDGEGSVVVQGEVGEKTVFNTPLMDGDVMNASSGSVGIRSLMCRNGSVTLSEEETTIRFWDETVVEGVEVGTRHVEWFRVETLEGHPYVLASVTANGTIRECSDPCRLRRSEEPQRFVVLQPRPSRGLKILLHLTPGVPPNTTATLASLLLYPQETFIYPTSYACSSPTPFFNTTSHAVLHGSFTGYNSTTVSRSPRSHAYVDFHLTLPLGEVEIALRKPPNVTHVEVSLPSEPQRFVRVEFPGEWVEVYRGDTGTDMESDSTSKRVVVRIRPVDGEDAFGVDAVRVRHVFPTLKKTFWMDMNGHERERVSDVWNMRALNVSSNTTLISSPSTPLGISTNETHTTLFRLSTPETTILAIPGQVTSTIIHNSTCILAGHFTHSVHVSSESRVFTYHNIAFYDLRSNQYIPPPHFSQPDISVMQFGVDGGISNIVLSGTTLRILGAFQNTISQTVVSAAQYAVYDLRVGWVPGEFTTDVNRVYAIPPQQAEDTERDVEWVVMSGSMDMQVEGVRVSGVAGVDILPVMMGPAVRAQTAVSRGDGVPGFLPSSRVSDGVWVHPTHGVSGSQTLYVAGKLYLPLFGSRYGLARWHPGTAGWEGLDLDVDVEIDRVFVSDGNAEGRVWMVGRFPSTSKSQETTDTDSQVGLAYYTISTHTVTRVGGTLIPEPHTNDTSTITSLTSSHSLIILSGPFTTDTHIPCSTLCAWDIATSQWTAGLPHVPITGKVNAIMSYKGYVVVGGRFSVNGKEILAGVYDWGTKKMIPIPIPPQNGESVEGEVVAVSVQGDTWTEITFVTCTHTECILWETQILETKHQNGVTTTVGVMAMYPLPFPNLTSITPLPFPSTYALTSETFNGLKSTVMLFTPSTGLRPLIHTSSHTGETHLQILPPPTSPVPSVMDDTRSGVPGWGTAVLVLLCVLTTALCLGVCVVLYSTMRRRRGGGEEGRKLLDEEHAVGPADDEAPHIEQQQEGGLENGVEAVMDTPTTLATTPNFFERQMMRGVSTPRLPGTLYIATHPNPGTEFGEIAFERGDTILVLSREDDEWWMGMVDYGTGKWGDIGVFPKTHVRLPVFYANRDIAGRPM